jgi:hypothetical protein
MLPVLAVSFYVNLKTLQSEGGSKELQSASHSPVMLIRPLSISLLRITLLRNQLLCLLRPSVLLLGV